jgi:hypothetical protein
VGTSEPREPSARPGTGDEPPPLLGSWRNVYLLLLAELAALVAAFALLAWWAA